jgi:hypothetical protein
MHTPRAASNNKRLPLAERRRFIKGVKDDVVSEHPSLLLFCCLKNIDIKHGIRQYGKNKVDRFLISSSQMVPLLFRELQKGLYLLWYRRL